MRKTRLLALTGFLGAGKTTTMAALAQHLESQGEVVAVITNDQGTELVDSAVAAAAVGLAAEVTGGCFCCRFEDLASVLEDILVAGNVDTVIIEAVGSCTDLQATVVRPLRRFYADQLEVAPLVAVVEPDRFAVMGPLVGSAAETDLAYLFDRQLAEADVIAVNKTESMPAEAKAALVAELADRYPRARVVPYSALAGRGLAAIVALMGELRPAWDVEVDYDRYAAAEAALAWLNLAVDLRAVAASGFGPATWVMTALEELAERCAAVAAVIGHIKIHLTGGDVSVTANLVGTGEPRLASLASGRIDAGRALVNARVELATGDLDAMVRAAIAAADAAAGTTSVAVDGPIAFQPGYPVPVHRLSAADASHAAADDN